MVRTSTLLLLGGALILGTCLSAAQQTPAADAREHAQKLRIKQGVKTGALTPRETRRLAHEQKAINKTEAKAKSDGTVTPRERAKLQHMQNRTSRDIRRQKHDAQVKKQ